MCGLRLVWWGWCWGVAAAGPVRWLVPRPVGLAVALAVWVLAIGPVARVAGRLGGRLALGVWVAGAHGMQQTAHLHIGWLSPPQPARFPTYHRASFTAESSSFVAPRALSARKVSDTSAVCSKNALRVTCTC